MHFPKHFLFGAALAGHQVEGNNIHSNWWKAESAGLVPPSGVAANHYHHFDSDFGMAKSLGLNAMRISLEWSRLEPVKGEWDPKAIEHYHHVFRSMKKHGLVPMVTLFHWTMPQWLASKGGFETEYGVKMFRRFVRKVAREYGRYCQLWLTINEPEVFVFE
jgi:beta-glucosidase